MDIGSLLIICFYAYIVIVTLFLILDNREPGSTLAWLIVFIAFPAVGVVVYLFIGRNWRTSPFRKKHLRTIMEKNMVKNLLPIIFNQEKEQELLRKQPDLCYKNRLLQLLYRNSYSLLVTSNDIRVLQNGKEKFPELIRDLKKAKKYIHLEYFIWRNDSLTEEIKDILIQKAKEGVEIRALFDAFGSFFLSRRYVRELRKAGIMIYPYFNFLSPFKLHTLNYRNHRKLVIIDGEVGYSGGMNLGKEYVDGGKRFSSWRDTHMRIRGQSVLILESIFASSWYNTTRENLFKEKYFSQDDSVKKVLPLQITASGPDSDWDSIRQLYFTLISSAEKKVYIQSPYFIPDPSVYEALKIAALSGIDVKIMLTGVPDKKIPYWAAFTYFKDLLKAGVRVYHYRKGFMHSKTIMIDSEICSLGTANMDIRSFMLSYEVNFLIYDRNISTGLEKDFKNDILSCREFTIRDYNRLNVFAKFRNSIMRLLTPLL